MPTYDYRCDGCGHEFERFQSMTDKPVRTCPACKGRSVRRLIGSGAAIIFKGSGFYETDYRSAEYKEKQKKEKDASSSTEGKADSAGKSKGSSSGKSEKSSSDSGSGD